MDLGRCSFANSTTNFQISWVNLRKPIFFQSMVSRRRFQGHKKWHEIKQTQGLPQLSKLMALFSEWSAEINKKDKKHAHVETSSR